MALTVDERAALTLLEDWYRRLEEVVTSIDERRDKAAIQSAYSAVKSAIEAECHTRDKGKHSAATERWLKSTFHDAFGHLSAPTNGQPAHIRESVYEAAGEFSHAIREMRDVSRKSPASRSR